MWRLVSKLMNNKRMLSNTEDNNEFVKVDDALQFFAFNMGNIDDLQNNLLRLGVALLNILNH
ncbi:hypothetical protein HN51_039697 [Arachis hypogaea]